jgi:hypothetical protein
MAHIERRRIRQADGSGRVRVVTRYRVRYRDESGRQHCETMMRLVDDERRKAEIEVALAGGTCRDPRRGEMRPHGLSCGCPRDMVFDRQPGPGSKPPCRSRSCLASATRRFARSRMVASDNGSPISWPAASRRRRPGRQCSRCASAWMPRSLTIDCSSIPPLPCRSRRSARSPHATYRRVRLSAWSTKCLLSIARWCWSVRTRDFGGEKRQVSADAISTRCAPASA